jgi:hypothetical protein
VASLTEAQFDALRQRRSNQDLADLILVLERDGELSVEGGGREVEVEDEETKEAASAARDEAIANSLLLSEPQGPVQVSEEEAKGNLEAAQAAGEVEEEAAPTRRRAASAAAEGS